MIAVPPCHVDAEAGRCDAALAESSANTSTGACPALISRTSAIVRELEPPRASREQGLDGRAIDSAESMSNAGQHSEVGLRSGVACY